MQLRFATLRATVDRVATTSHPHGVWTAFRVLRTKDGQSLTDIHRATGLSLGHLSDLENGRRLPTPQVLKKIARALNVPVSVLERTQPVEPQPTGNAISDADLQDLVRRIVREELDARGLVAA